MGLTEEILSELETKPIDDLRVGIKYTGVMVENRIGVARTIFSQCETPHKVGNLKGKNVANLISSKKSIEASIGCAAINAQITLGGKIKKGNVFERIIKMAEDCKTIGVIGKFPFVNKINRNVYVFEKKSIPGTLPASEADEILPKCDLVVITGSAFINKSLEHLLVISGGYTMVIGPSTPLSPVLFEFGADLLAGIYCENRNVLDVVGQGGGTKDFIRMVDNIIMENQ